MMNFKNRLAILICFVLFANLNAICSSKTDPKKNTIQQSFNIGINYSIYEIELEYNNYVLKKPYEFDESYGSTSRGVSPGIGYSFEYINFFRFGAKAYSYIHLSNEYKNLDLNAIAYIGTPSLLNSYLGINLVYHRIFTKKTYEMHPNQNQFLWGFFVASIPEKEKLRYGLSINTGVDFISPLQAKVNLGWKAPQKNWAFDLCLYLISEENILNPDSNDEFEQHSTVESTSAAVGLEFSYNL